jgi:hypothetical protein
MPHYDDQLNQYTNAEDLTVVTPAAKTATFTSPAVNCTRFSTADLTLAVTAVAGTSPTLDVVIQTREYGGSWASIGAAFAQKVAAGTQRLTFPGLRDEVHAVCTIGGSAGQSVTFGVTGVAK